MSQKQILQFHVFDEITPSIDKLIKIKSLDWETDLFHAITRHATKHDILGIFFNVYKHAMGKPEYLYKVYLVMKQACFENSCFDKPNLFFEFFQYITTEENDMYTYVYYLLKIAKTKKTKLMSYVNAIYLSESGRNYARTTYDLELKEFKKSPEQIVK